MRRPLIAGNWKMYKTIPEALEFVQEFRPLIAVGAQDVAAESGPGAFTGEVSAAMIKDAGARYAIIGHSERRQYYDESDHSVNRKIRAADSAGLLPVVCVGEHIEDRDAGRAETFIGGQLAEGLLNLTVEEAARMIIAYEPIWAIGTGRTATPYMAEQMHSFIRVRIREMFGEEVAAGMRILYGGSVKPDNIAELMNEADIDGALVGGASLEAASFAKIVNYKENR